MSLPSTLRVMPKGEYYCPSLCRHLVFDDLALEKVCHAIQQEAGNLGANHAGMLLDFDGASYDAKRSSTAAGWLSAPTISPGGLNLSVVWSDLGHEAITGKRYKFLAPRFRKTDIVDAGNGWGRPLRLDAVSLTNLVQDRNVPLFMNRANATTSQTPEQSQQFAFNDATRAANRLGAIAEHLRTNGQAGFQKGWNLAVEQFPDLAEKAGIQTGQDWQSKLPAMETDEVQRVMAVLLLPNLVGLDQANRKPVGLRGIFQQAVDELTYEDMTVEQAVDHLATTEPIFWRKVCETGWK